MGHSRQESLGAERAVLGAVLLDCSVWPHIAASLTAEDFCLDEHKKIYRAMQTLAKDNQPIDCITLLEQLGSHLEKMGGMPYLAELVDGVVPCNTKAYVREVCESARVRRTAQQLERMLDSLSEARLDRRGASRRLRQDAQSLVDSLTDSTDGIQCCSDLPEVSSMQVDDIAYIVPDLVARGTVTLLTGDSGIGKSYFTLKLAVACALGTEFLSRRCERTKVLILDRENPLRLVRKRLRMLAGGPVPGLHIWGGWVPDPPPAIGDPRLLKIAASEQPLIIFDSFVRFHAADENDASEMRDVMACLRRLADVGAAPLLVHHRPKSQELKYRGSSDILASVDAAYALERDDNNSYLTLDCFKSRDSAERTYVITADFATGRIELTASTAPDEIQVLKDIITNQPGLTQNRILEQSGQQRNRAHELLIKHTGILWQTQTGVRKALRYYPLNDSSRPVPGPVPAPPFKISHGHKSTSLVRTCSDTCTDDGYNSVQDTLVPVISTPKGGITVQVASRKGKNNGEEVD